MAKSLVFQTDKQYSFSITKLDRKKLYGWKEVTAFDENGDECIKVEIDETGSFMIPKGGKALGILNQNNEWVDKKDLIAVYKDGSPAKRIKSSFDEIIELKDKMSIDEFLEHKINSVYLLEFDQENELNEGFLKIIKASNDIYYFTFSYRSDYEGQTAFLIENKSNIFMLLGSKCEFEYVGLEQTTDISTEDDADTSLDDDIDFSMM